MIIQGNVTIESNIVLGNVQVPVGIQNEQVDLLLISEDNTTQILQENA